MATVTLDLIQDVSCREEYGFITGLTRMARVEGLNGSDSSILAAALAASGMPAIGDEAPGNSNLILIRRSPKIMEGSPDKVDVQLEYIVRTRAGFTYWSGLGINSGSLFTWSGGTNLSQATTILDRHGNQVSVSHTFSESDPNPDYAGQTLSQVPELNVSIPHSTVTGQGLLRASYPDAIAKAFTGYINSNWWAGEAPYTWQCVSVDWDPMDTSSNPRVFQFTFTFEHNPFTHLPQVFYRDERTGRAPVNLVAGTGYGYVDFYPAFDFNRFFPI